ncbi:thioredoxin family protein isoform X2 [Wolffia australiana]
MSSSSSYVPCSVNSRNCCVSSTNEFREFVPKAANLQWGSSFGHRNVRILGKRNRATRNGVVCMSSKLSSDSPNGGGSSSASFLSVLCPLLKLFAGGDPSAERNGFLEATTSSLSSLARFPWGKKSLQESSRQKDEDNPPLLLQLYEFEACPFCRRVREALTDLDLTVEVYPCPKGSVRHREIVGKLGGKEQFPFLVDPNTGTLMYESGDIVKYLFQQYGQGRSPTFGLLESTLVTGWMPTLLRAGRGMSRWSKARTESPPERLELFSYETNPQARIVREALCELELSYILHNVGDGSSKIETLLKISGSKEERSWVTTRKS